jgi:membrane protein implicated in regulation of membrane protease activity
VLDSFIYALPNWLLFIIIVGGSVCLAWVGTVFMRRRTKEPEDDSHNEVAGFIFAAVSVVYTVFLAFVAVTVWEQYVTAENAAAQEAAALVDVARTCDGFPEPARSQVHDLLRQYAEIVITQEWQPTNPDAPNGEGSPQALAVINQVWTIYRGLPSTSVDSSTTTALDELSQARAARLLANEASLPAPFWFVLVVGAAITICFCLVLHMVDIRLHAGMTALLTGLLAMCIWLIVAINQPLAGDLHVSPDAFEYALHVINNLPR